MPRLVNSSSPSACVRLAISTTSTPPMRTAAQSPSGTCVGPKLCQQSRASRATVTVASTGAPDAGPILPPKRSGNVAPSPASKHSLTAIGSQIGPTAAPSTLRSIRWRRMVVLSDGAPPPALSAGSASTTGATLLATRRGHALRHLEELRHRLAAHGHQLLADASWPAGLLWPCRRRRSPARGSSSRAHRRRGSSARWRSTGCRPCPPSLLIRSTNARISGSVVGYICICRQS